MVDFWTYVPNFRWGWVDAVRKAEASGDLRPLARLLRSDAPMEQSMRNLLAQLFDRHRLGRRRGRPPKPLFGPTVEDPNIVVLRHAEQSGDLGALARLLRSDTPVDKATRDSLADLFNRHRLARKRGRPKSVYNMTARDGYIVAANAVKRLRETKRRWKEVEGAEIALGHEGLNEQVRSYVEGLEAITDPIDYVAAQLGFDGLKLQNFMEGKPGFGRKAKPKPKPDM